MEKEYKTKSKEEITSILRENSDRRFTAADIISTLKNRGSMINPTTVYRNLERLSKTGAVIKLKTPDSDSALYQSALGHENCKEHLHLQCEKCGSLIHLECGFMHEISHHLLDDHGFVINCKNSVLLGLCSECAGK